MALQSSSDGLKEQKGSIRQLVALLAQTSLGFRQREETAENRFCGLVEDDFSYGSKSIQQLR